MIKRTASPRDKIKKLRDQIDRVDNRILALLFRRFELVAKIGKLKLKAAVPVTDSSRERHIFERLLQRSKNSMLDRRLIAGIWSHILKKSYQIQRRVANEKR